jgi:hypothetical protein
MQHFSTDCSFLLKLYMVLHLKTIDIVPALFF